jgi:stearoyl-CoA desaturase (Delta-9 desaturase)
VSLSPYGLVHLPLWGYFLVTFLTIQSMFLGVTLYLHRDQSHGSVVLHPLLRHLFRFWLWFSSGAITRQWVAVHRCHHANADQPGDPHSPLVFGLRRVLFEGYEIYQAAAADRQLLERYGRGTPDDWLERYVYARHSYTGIVLFVIAHLVLFGIAGIIMIAVHLSAHPFFGGGVINGLGHAVGYRSFELPTAATNLLPWGLLIGGEELHNNHHAFPRSACFAVQRWEVDMGWLWIRLFSALGLARVRWVAPRPHLVRRRRELDAESVDALFTNRLHVLRAYTRRVVLPVCRELARREPRGALPAGMARLLIRHPALLAEEARRRLCELLENYEVLRRVVEYRDSLQALWESPANPARALSQLREWCSRAEGSGIGALREFAQALPAYSG